MSLTIDKDYCKGCTICVVVCKPGALSPGTERNAKSYLVPAHDPELCVACGNCAVTCPELAITVVKDKEKSHA